METIIITLAFYFGLAILWINSEPTITTRRLLGFKEEDYDSYTNWKRFIHRGINCLFCSAFWLTLIVSQSFETSVIVSLIAFIYDNHFNR